MASETPPKIIGIDLTDPYASRPRAVDIAVVAPSGECEFKVLPAPGPKTNPAVWLADVTAGPDSGDSLVIDGPLGLAAEGSGMRECERLITAPGKTPDVLPAPGSRPFAGFVRGGVELANALIAAGLVPARDGGPVSTATMLEAYPGGSWTRLAGARLPPKTTAAGLRARAALLSRNGLRFARNPQSHDQLDAALCAWLGWTLRRHPDQVTALGRRCFISGGHWREGVILQVVGTLRPEPRRAEPCRAAVGTGRVVALPAGVKADWVYFATPARANQWETAELALREGVICRPAHNVKGMLIANVGRVRPGEILLLAYSGGKDMCEAIGTFLVEKPDNPVPGAPALHKVAEPALRARLAANYPPDGFLGAHTAFLVETIWTPELGVPVMMSRPTGNNALWRATP